jgi:hypothetical protein
MPLILAFRPASASRRSAAEDHDVISVAVRWCVGSILQGTVLSNSLASAKSRPFRSSFGNSALTLS